MEIDLNFWEMKDNLNYFGKLKMISIFWQMEEDLNILANRGQPQYFEKWKIISILWLMEDDLNIGEKKWRTTCIFGNWTLKKNICI